MFCITVELLTGRFVATDYADRQEAEWPPHPARLFSALVAAYADLPNADERAALEWVETLPPPLLAATQAARRDVLTVFVPVNDTSVVGSFEDKAAEVAQAEAAVADAAVVGDRRKLAAAEKQLDKARKVFLDSTRRATAAEIKVSDSEIAAAESLLPDQRKRRPRTFPSVCPVEPRFSLVWPEIDPPEHLLAALNRLCARVVRLGHSSSLVSLHIPPVAPPPTLRPDPDGPLTLRVVQPGQLTRLEESFMLHQQTAPRVMPAAFQRYAVVNQSAETVAAAESCFSADWIVLRRVDGDRLPISVTVALATAVRGALLHHAPDPRDELLSGHAREGQPALGDHLAIVPLPFVGRPHADGELKGVALVFPRGADGGARRAVYQAIGAWEQASRKGDYAAAEHPPLSVFMGRPGKVSLEFAEDNLAHTLLSTSWCSDSRHWASVTPVALDHNPGELRRRPDADPATETTRIEAVVRRAEASVCRAVTRVGLPEPTAVVLSPQPSVVGSRPCRGFPGFVSGRHPRVLVHVTLSFAEPVRGPLLLGAGRYYGYGLLRPVEES